MKKVFIILAVLALLTTLYAGTRTELRVMQGNTAAYTAQINDIDSIIFVDIHVPDPTDVLYMIGDATPGGWFVESATPMRQDKEDADRFIWSGVLNQGEFKLLTTNTAWNPCFVRDWEDPTLMHYRETDDDYPDHKWSISPKARSSRRF